MEDETWLMEMTSKLTGVIFKKALLEDSLEKVYTRVFEHLLMKTYEEDMHILEIFGSVGG